MSEQALRQEEVRFDQGIDLARVRMLLAQARERGGPAQETVTTLNLIAVYFTEEQYERARPALEAAATLHPCRLLALVANPLGPSDSLRASVSVARSGGAITVERIVLTATGRSVRHLEPALLGLLVPELPRVVVWGGRPHGDLLRHAIELADRVIIDSGARPPTFLPETAELLAHGAPLGDLAWARIFPWQALAADVLDLPTMREHRGNIQTARVVCAGNLGAEGVLLAGWIASRVKRIKVDLRSEGQAPAPDEQPPPAVIPHPAPLTLGQVTLFQFTAPPATFTFRREKQIVVAEVKGDDDGYCVSRVRLPAETPGRLLSLELKLLSGVDELYAAAMQAGVKLLAERM